MTDPKTIERLREILAANKAILDANYAIMSAIEQIAREVAPDQFADVMRAELRLVGRDDA